MALPPTDRYHRNQAALRAFQPSVAAILDEVAIPEEVKPATGRDGSDTFLIPDETGRHVWFGGSSMPGISAAEIFAGFRGDGSNASLPGVLTGVEPLVVAGQMAAHTALFVVEQDPLQLKLAMHLRDYSDLFAGGRLVFVLIEFVGRGRRVPPEKEGMVHLIGFALLIGFAIFITYFDILRVVRGESFLPK